MSDMEKAREIMRNGLPLGELDNYKDSRKLLDVIAQALSQARQEERKKVNDEWALILPSQFALARKEGMERARQIAFDVANNSRADSFEDVRDEVDVALRKEANDGRSG